MYTLFLESKAAQQVDTYCAAKGLNADEVKKSLYRNGLLSYSRHDDLGWDDMFMKWDNHWVNMCLEDQRHRLINVDKMCIWVNTPEGHPFWSSISSFQGGR